MIFPQWFLTDERTRIVKQEDMSWLLNRLMSHLIHVLSYCCHCSNLMLFLLLCHIKKQSYQLEHGVSRNVK